MRNRFLLGMMALSLIGMTSCKDEIDQFDDHGSSTIVSFAGTEKAYMGDSITFDFEVKSGGVKINQAKVQLYYGEEMVSENTVEKCWLPTRKTRLTEKQRLYCASKMNVSAMTVRK